MLESSPFDPSEGGADVAGSDIRRVTAEDRVLGVSVEVVAAVDGFEVGSDFGGGAEVTV